jgi:enoyl-CoA hydratase/carnithine racemase
MEIALNCDIVVAGEATKFALPEVKRGVVAIQGGQDDICGDQRPISVLIFGTYVQGFQD